MNGRIIVYTIPEHVGNRLGVRVGVSEKVNANLFVCMQNCISVCGKAVVRTRVRKEACEIAHSTPRRMSIGIGVPKKAAAAVSALGIAKPIEIPG